MNHCALVPGPAHSNKQTYSFQLVFLSGPAASGSSWCHYTRILVSCSGELSLLFFHSSLESTRQACHICVDAASSPTHSLDACLQRAAAAQTMSGLSLTPPTPLRILLKQMAWEQLQDTGRQKDRSRWAGIGKDAGGEEVPGLLSFLNIVSCYPELTEAKEIMVKSKPGKTGG